MFPITTQFAIEDTSYSSASNTGFKQATVNASLVPSTQTNFPAYVDLARLGIGTPEQAHSIRVYSDSGKTTELARDIVSPSEMWVKIPSLTSSFTIYVDWDYSRAPYASTATFGQNATWPSQFVLVSHLDEDPNAASPQIINSTSGTGGATQGSMTKTDEIAGKIGSGIDFDGTDDELRYSDTNFQNFTTTQLFAYAMWVKTTVSVDANITDNRTASTTPFTTTIVGGASGGVAKMLNRANSAARHYTFGTAVVNDGTWKRIWFTRDGSLNGTGGSSGAQQIYVNGVKDTISSETVDAASSSDYASGSLLRVAGGLNAFMASQMDELYLWKGSIPSSDWITVDYNNQSNESSFWGTWTTVSSGSSFFQNCSETVTHTDSLIRQGTKILAETATITATLIKSVSKFLSETVTNSDTVLKSFLKTLGLETITHTDTLLRQGAKTMSETVTNSDTIKKDTSKPLTQTITHTDSIIKAITKLLTTETVTHTDSVTPVKTFLKTLSESVTLSDTLKRDIAKTLTEAATLSDTIKKDIAKLLTTETVTSSDTLTKIKLTLLTLAETVTHTDTLIRQAQKTLSETSTMADSLTKQSQKTLSESSTLSDSLVAIRSFLKTLSEAATLSDSLVKQTTKLATETITHSDTIKKDTSKTRTETVTHTDSLTAQKSYLKQLLETVTHTDTLIRQTAKLIANTITLSDTIKKDTSKTRTESVTYTDSLVKQGQRVFVETVVFTDSIIRQIGKVLTENVNIVSSLAALGSAIGGMVKVFLNGVWVSKPIKRWTGSAWVVAKLKRWTGSIWDDTP